MGQTEFPDWLWPKNPKKPHRRINNVFKQRENCSIKDANCNHLLLVTPGKIVWFSVTQFSKGKNILLVVKCKGLKLLLSCQNVTRTAAFLYLQVNFIKMGVALLATHLLQLPNKRVFCKKNEWNQNSNRNRSRILILKSEQSWKQYQNRC